MTLGVPRGKLAPKATASYSVLLAPGGCHVDLPSGIAMHLRVWSWALIYGRRGEKATSLLYHTVLHVRHGPPELNID